MNNPCFQYLGWIEVVPQGIPDKTSIFNFHHLLDENDINAQIYEMVMAWSPETGPG